MLKQIRYILPIFALGACAYAIDGAHQDVRFETPGAYNATCYVYVEQLKYRVRPPNALNLYKSDQDLIVDCFAPGNRRITETITPKVEQSVAWNAGNAGAGVAWDYLSKAMFRYPDLIVIDFTNTPVVDPPIPAQNQPDIRQPEEYYLEEFSPSSPRLNSDRDQAPIEILKRQSPGPIVPAADEGAAFSEPAKMGGDKGDLMQVIDSLGDNMNPSATAPASSAPTPLVPGE